MTFEEGSQGAFDKEPRRRYSDQGRNKCLWGTDGRCSGVAGEAKLRRIKAKDYSQFFKKKLGYTGTRVG